MAIRYPPRSATSRICLRYTIYNLQSCSQDKDLARGRCSFRVLYGLTDSSWPIIMWRRHWLWQFFLIFQEEWDGWHVNVCRCDLGFYLHTLANLNIPNPHQFCPWLCLELLINKQSNPLWPLKAPGTASRACRGALHEFSYQTLV